MRTFVILEQNNQDYQITVPAYLITVYTYISLRSHWSSSHYVTAYLHKAGPSYQQLSADLLIAVSVNVPLRVRYNNTHKK